MVNVRARLEQIKEEGRIFNSIEVGRLGGMSRARRRTEIIRKIKKFTSRALPYSNIAVWQLALDRPELVPLFSRGYGRALRGYRLRPQMFANGIVGYVAHIGYPYIARDLTRDPHYLPGIKNALSSITVPLKIADEVFGVLNVESTKRSAFHKDDVAILREYAGYVAVALNIGRLLDIGEESTAARIVRTVSHEINNPLNTIFMTLSKIDAVREQLSPFMLDVVRTINQNFNLIKSAVASMGRMQAPDTDEQYEIIDIEGDLAGRRILVIEDDEPVRRLLRSILESEDCIVDEAADGPEGIKAALHNDYDIVITDIKMPTCSGYEVFRRVRRRKKDQKIVMITGFGYDESHAIVKSSDEGLNGVLYKPFTHELLRKVLARVCV